MLYYIFIIENMNYDIKVIIVGIDKIGKSCFRSKISNFNNNHETLIREYKKTIVAELSFKIIKKQKINIRIQLWDLEWNINTINIFVKDAHVILMFYDSMNRQSFEKVKNLYFSDLKVNKAIFFMVRSQYDLKNKPSDNSDIVSDEEVLEFVNKNKMNFAHISNIEKYETGIDNLFDNLFSSY